MNKKDYKYLFKNIGLLTISNFSSKLLMFFLVPIYSRELSTEEYGTYDIISTTIALLFPIITIDIHESVLRFSLDNGIKKQRKSFSYGLYIMILSIILIALAIFINHCFRFFAIIDNYAFYVFMFYIAYSLKHLMYNFSRGIERVKDYAIASLISSMTCLSLNILFLVFIKGGLKGFIIAQICSFLMPVLYLSIRIKIWKYVSFTRTDKSLCREMREFSIPLIYNQIGWWINNSSDRYVVIALSGVSENGIYSLAYKIPSILNAFQMVFNQAWILSATKSFDPEDKEGFFSNIYNTYNFFMVIICSMIIMGSKLIAKIMYGPEFYNAWMYAPFLTIAVIFGALSGVLGGVFSAVKDSRIFSQSTIIGAVINILLNIILVAFMGAIGAAIATAISYIVVWFIRLYHVKKYITFRMHLKRDCISYILLFFMAVILLTKLNYYIYCILQFFSFVSLLCLYKNIFSIAIDNLRKLI